MRFDIRAVMASMVGGFVRDQLDSLRGVEDRQVRSVRFQFVHPVQFEADVSDAEVSFASREIDQLLRSRVVGFWASSFWNHARYAIPVAGNGFRKIPQRFQRNGDCLLPVGRLVSACRQTEQDEAE